MFESGNGHADAEMEGLPVGRAMGRALSFLRGLSLDEIDQELSDAKAEVAGLQELRKVLVKMNGGEPMGERKAGRPVSTAARLERVAELLSDGSTRPIEELANHAGYKPGKEGFLIRALANDERFDFDSTRKTATLAR